jgi:predicted  nucleic acid-binding Zn-ribbon protein
VWSVNRKFTSLDIQIENLLSRLYHLDLSMSYAEWMWIRSEWNAMKIERTSLRKRLANLQKKLSEYEVEYRQVTE